MKKNPFPGIVRLFCLFMFLPFTGCLKDKMTRTYTLMRPVLEKKETVLDSINSPGPVPLHSPGKIYLSGKYIYLNEIDKGVHIIDNTDPAHPENIAFIRIPGNLDIAVRGNILYADFYRDMLAIDISNPRQAVLKKIVNNVFPERYYGNGFSRPDGMAIVDWIRKDTTVVVDSRNGGPSIEPCRNCYFLLNAGTDNSAAATVPGVGGSMARFAVVNDYLYAVDRHTMTPVSLSNPADPQPGESLSAGYDIETIYPFRDKLFLGSMGGLFIYNLTDPSHPQKEGEFAHARACDPVVTDGQFAYITLRKGTSCGPVANELLAVDVQDLANPELVQSYPMTNPYGLSIDGHTLYVCDGSDGLKVFDAADAVNLKLIDKVQVDGSYDVIAWNKHLILVGREGLVQYDCSNPSSLERLSSIPVE